MHLKMERELDRMKMNHKFIKRHTDKRNIANNKPSYEYDYNLEFFNLLYEINFENSNGQYEKIETIDQLFKRFRIETFKCKNQCGPIYENIKSIMNKTKQDMTCLRSSLKKSSSCPTLNRISCITSNIHRCIFTSIQANVTQAFKLMDAGFDNKLFYPEFRNGLLYILFERNQLNMNGFKNDGSLPNTVNEANRQQNGIDESLILGLFNRFDISKNGQINFVEFYRVIKAPICPKRLSIINRVFNKLDVKKEGVLKLSDLEHWYSNTAKTHPKYLNGEWDVKKVLEKSLSYYELPGENTGIITRDKFIAYYSTISATVLNDAYFDLIMRKTFNL